MYRGIGGPYSIGRDVGHVDGAFAPLGIDLAAVECDAGVCTPGILADAVIGSGGTRGC